MEKSSLRPLTVEEALTHVLAGARPINGNHQVDLLAAHGAVLAAPLLARHTQPPFNASAMDGYAVRTADIAVLPTVLRIIGEASAGHSFTRAVAAGEAVRIFTGAPLPAGADAVVIQENTRRDGTAVTITDGHPEADHIRPRGGDFSVGQMVLAAGTHLAARHLTLAAAAGYAHVSVRRPPRVAILATGDELVLPAEQPSHDQIICSNPYGVAAMVKAAGGLPVMLGIARDTAASLDEKIAEARGADILVTLGGASVGDHDLVAPALARHGMELAFWKIAMRPGKPMLFGHLGAQHVLGLPGNPVSSLITARLFLVPLIRAMLGMPTADAEKMTAILDTALPPNGPRAHYMRAARLPGTGSRPRVRPQANQDSSLLTPLAAADCLIVRPILAPALAAGAEVPVLPMDF